MELVRIDEANAAVSKIDDPVTRALVRYSLNLVIGKFINWEGGEDKRDLPVSAFDALFFVRCMSQVFSNRERISRTLGGEVIDEFATL